MTLQQKENVKELIKALRSGEYKQTMGYLCQLGGSAPGHCCLGVACEVAIKRGLDIPKSEQFTLADPGGGIVYYDHCECNLPPLARDFYGFRHTDGGAAIPNSAIEFTRTGIVWTDDMRSLTRMNDRGKTFAEIADFIEKALNTEGYFGLFTAD